MCILEREREHIESIWSRVTCLDSPLAAQSLARQALGDSRSLRLLTVVIGNKQYKKINKQYIKQYQKNLLVAMNICAQESPKSELRLRSYEGLKLID
jgi:spore maturation protein CgeB